MKIGLSLLFIGCYVGAYAQSAFELGTGVSYDYGIVFPEGTQYSPYDSGQTSMYSVDVFFSFPFLRVFTFSPTYIYSMPARTQLVGNPEGDYIPQGYSINGTASTDPFYYYYSPDYYTLTSEAETWQKSFGAFFTLDLGVIQIGSGYFLRKRETYVYDFMAYDEYVLAESDHPDDPMYVYDLTYEYEWPSLTTEITDNRISIPLFLTYSSRFAGPLFFRASAIKWSGEGSEISFRFSTGVTF